MTHEKNAGPKGSAFFVANNDVRAKKGKICYTDMMPKENQATIGKQNISLKLNPRFFPTLIAAAAVIFVWRGIWNLLDMYLLPDHFVLSNIISITIGLLLLYLPDGKIDDLL